MNSKIDEKPDFSAYAEKSGFQLPYFKAAGKTYSSRKRSTVLLNSTLLV